MTTDELASRTGTTVRTIRWYQSEGLLPPPARVGREARYGPAHLERLTLIAELRARGLRLAAVADLLERAPEGTTADAWFGLDETLRRPWSEDRPALCTADELVGRLGDVPPGTLDDLERHGLVERRADTTPVVWLVPSPGLLDVAVRSVRLGLDVATQVRLQEPVRAHLREVAEGLVAGFDADVSVGRLAAGGPQALAELLEAVRPLTRRAVDLLFAHEMERATADLLDQMEEERGDDVN